MAKIYNLARMTTATVGTGTITLGSAISGYLTLALAGVTSGDVISYGIKDGANSEVGYGVATDTAGTWTLTRTVTKSTNSNNAISLSGTAEVFTTIRAEDVPSWPTNSGQLQYSSSSSVKFMPYNGNLIRIAGNLYEVPSAGIDSGNPNGGVRLNGTGSSSLTAGTLYYAYIYNDAGTLRMDFSTTAHAVDSTAGNVGTEIKSGDASRSFIGMVRTASGPIFVSSTQQRFVRSWFNDHGIETSGSFSTDRTTTSGSLVEINSEIRNEFLLFSGERIISTMSGSAALSVSGGNVYYAALSIDGGTAEVVPQAAVTNPANFYGSTFALTVLKTGLSEGYHYTTVFGACSAGTATFRGPTQLNGGVALVTATRR